MLQDPLAETLALWGEGSHNDLLALNLHHLQDQVLYATSTPVCRLTGYRKQVPRERLEAALLRPIQTAVAKVDTIPRVLPVLYSNKYAPGGSGSGASPGPPPPGSPPEVPARPRTEKGGPATPEGVHAEYAAGWVGLGVEEF